MKHEARTAPGMAFVRSYPADAVAVSLAVLVVDLLAVVLPGESTVRTVASVGLMLFLPGYALTTVLFPGRTTAGKGTARHSTPGIDSTERLALSFGLSVALLPVIALVIGATVGFTLGAVLAALTVVVLFTTQVGVARRARLAAAERYTVPFRAMAHDVRTGVFGSGWLTGTVNLLLGVAVVLAVATVAFGVAAPRASAEFSEFSLLTETAEGQFVAGGYPSELTLGEPVSLAFAVENHEGREVTYTVVAQLQRVDEGGTVVERRSLDRFQRTVGSGETWEHPHVVTATAVGEDLRLTYLLYRGDVPAEPTEENAYERTHIWVTVTE